MFLKTIRRVIMLLALGAAALPAQAEVLPGPYLAAVERVVDGDTLAVRVTVWLGQDVRVLVRLRGVDAPELRGRCELEKARAAKASAALTRLVEGGSIVMTEIEGDKYYGRVVADVVTPAGKDVAASLIESGHVRAYDGRSRGAWCEVGALTGEAEVARSDAP